MKVILTSPDALIDKKTGEFFPGIIEELNSLLEEEHLEAIIVISGHANKLENIPEPLIPFKVNHSSKRSGGVVNTLVRRGIIEAHKEIIVLGASESDSLMAFNSKLLLLSANYSSPDRKVSNYGLPINSPYELYNLFARFASINEHCYYELSVDERVMLFSIMNANSKGHTIEERVANLKGRMTRFLKTHVSKHGNLFLNYFIISLYYKIAKLRNIDYWGTYPSSGKGVYNEDMQLLKERARIIFKGRHSEEILIRRKDAEKRSYMGGEQRDQIACDDQLDTIMINPYYDGRLVGSTVCIIDDFCRSGSSCETARLVLQHAGVAQIYFVTIGKFGREYIKYFYDIGGNPYEGVNWERMRTRPHWLVGNFYNESDEELKTVFGDIL